MIFRKENVCGCCFLQRVRVEMANLKREKEERNRGNRISISYPFHLLFLSFSCPKTESIPSIILKVGHSCPDRKKLNEEIISFWSYPKMSKNTCLYWCITSFHKAWNIAFEIPNIKTWVWPNKSRDVLAHGTVHSENGSGLARQTTVPWPISALEVSFGSLSPSTYAVSAHHMGHRTFNLCNRIFWRVQFMQSNSWLSIHLYTYIVVDMVILC